MDGTISIQQVEKIRREFKEYLRAAHPEWSDNSVSMHYSDAFYIFNNNVGLDFWSCFTSNVNLLEVRDRIINHLVEEKQSGRAKERADGYMASMKHFKSFLDEKHPTLAQEWSGKAVSDAYLKIAFQNWMRSQKKSNSELYKSATVTAYTNALKNSTAKLNLDNVVHTDLFHYTAPEEFEEVYQKITSAPNFRVYERKNEGYLR